MSPPTDECSKSFETILYHSGKFGSYQRRVFAAVSSMHVVCSAILVYTTLFPVLEVREECIEQISAPGNASLYMMLENGSFINPLTCRKYVANDLGLENDWVFPPWIYPNNMTYSRAWIYYCKAGGLAFGFISGGVMSDNFGRRRTTYASFILLCAAQCMTGLFQSLVAFIVCQFCVGTGAGCFILSSLVLVIECLGHDWRDICLCLLPWWTGPSLLSLGAWFLRHWRHLAVISGLAGAPLIGTYFLVLESSRWLICKNRFAEAESVTKEMIACNCKPVPDMTSLFDISRACVLTTMHTKKYCYSDFMSTRRLRKATVALVFTWLPGCMVYCSLLRRLARLTSSVYLGHVLVFNSASVVIGSAVLINKCIGRRWCMFLYAMSTGLVSACVLVLHVTNDVIDQQMVTWLAFFANLGVTATMTLLAVVTLETFPTVIRSMACSVGLLLGLVGYIITDLLHVYLDPFHYTVPFLVYGALMTLVALGMLGFPETGRTPLPDILRCRHRKLCAHESLNLRDAWTT